MSREGLRRALEVLALPALFLAGYGFPAPSGHGLLEVLAAFLFPAALFLLVLRGRPLGWAFLGLFLAFAGVFHWVPRTVAYRGGLPMPLGLLSGALLMAYEALGLLGVAAATRWAFRRRGPGAAAATAALALLLWETILFHQYPWSLGAALGGLPLTARGAAFLGSHGLAALLWGAAALSAALRAQGKGLRRVLAVPATLAALLLVLAALWPLLPRGPRRELDVVMVQPGFEPGLRLPGMEAEMWRRSDAELRRRALPRPGVATLLLWPESSVMGRDDRHPDPRLPLEAQRRGIAWLYGTEGGLLNLLRGEAAGRPAFLQAKVEPMYFGERMPGPPRVRAALDRALGMVSQEPGELTPQSSFQMPTPQGELRVHPLLCSEALSEDLVRRGLALAGGELLSNHANDGWFERSMATDLHAAQIRLRAVEAGVPLLRATLTGKSGIFREDGHGQLWGEPMSEAAYAIHLEWRPVRTPARSPWLPWAILGILCAGWAWLVLGPEMKVPLK